jgi:hypothetical protein
MEKHPRNTKQIRAARDFLHCVILEQRAATEELKASNRELESVLEDLVSSRAELKNLAVDEREEPAAPSPRGAEPADQSLVRLRKRARKLARPCRMAVRTPKYAMAPAPHAANIRS